MFYDEGGETLAQVVDRSCGCSMTGSAQSQVGWSFEQHIQVKDVLTHCKGIGLDELKANDSLADDIYMKRG